MIVIGDDSDDDDGRDDDDDDDAVESKDKYIWWCRVVDRLVVR
jgi:hypothetical protein